MSSGRVEHQVRVVGSGLLGTSIGLGLRARGVEVIVDDVTPSAARLAIAYGAGREPTPDDVPGVIVVAVPPDATASVVADELTRHPTAVVTDVAGVKAAPLAELRARGADLTRYLGTHPMAGRERSGAMSARADLFTGRPWVVARHDDASIHSVRAVEDLILDLSGVIVEMDVDAHDESVALVSHAPQVISSLIAARLASASRLALGLGGQRLNDITRIASSDPGLWTQILSANAESVAAALRPIRDDLDRVIAALDAPDAPRSQRTLVETLAAGVTGVARIPGKPGQDSRLEVVAVRIDDRQGELARLLRDVSDEGMNVEDLWIEHSGLERRGTAHVSVLHRSAESLAAALGARTWDVVFARGDESVTRPDRSSSGTRG